MLFEPRPETYQRDVSLRGMVGAVLFVGAAVGLAMTSTGHRWIGADRGALLGCFVAYVAIYALNVALMRQDEWLLKERAWPFRALGCAAAATIGCMFAATAPFDASAAWVIHLVIAMAIGISVQPTHWMFVLFTIPPLLLRATFVPDATGLSYAVLTGAALTAHAVYLRSSHIMRREHEYGRQAEAVRSVVAEQVELSANMRTAMSLHDGLSGSLLALRHQLRNMTEFTQAAPQARAWLLQARTLVQQPLGDQPLEDHLRRSATSLGIELDLSLDLNESELDRPELADLRWITTELIANAAAHSENRRLDLRIRGGKTGVRVVTLLDSERVGETRSGRGFRNIELRARSQGGAVSLSGGTLTVRWERPVELEQLLIRSALELFVIVGLFCAGLLWIDPRPGPLSTAFLALVFLFAGFWDRFARVKTAERRLQETKEERLTAEQGQVLRLAEQGLRPQITQVEAALGRENLSELRGAFDQMATQLKDIMWTLEWSGNLDSLREDLRDFARDAGLSLPEIPAEAVDDPLVRFRLVVSLKQASTS